MAWTRVSTTAKQRKRRFMRSAEKPIDPIANTLRGWPGEAGRVGRFLFGSKRRAFVLCARLDRAANAIIGVAWGRMRSCACPEGISRSFAVFALTAVPQYFLSPLARSFRNWFNSPRRGSLNRKRRLAAAIRTGWCLCEKKILVFTGLVVASGQCWFQKLSS